jgi:hypothetical protein
MNHSELVGLGSIDLLKFAFLVNEMRQSQKYYFKTRDKDMLIKSKNLEKAVDSLLSEILK